MSAATVPRGVLRVERPSAIRIKDNVADTLGKASVIRSRNRVRSSQITGGQGLSLDSVDFRGRIAPDSDRSTPRADCWSTCASLSPRSLSPSSQTRFCATPSQSGDGESWNATEFWPLAFAPSLATLPRTSGETAVIQTVIPGQWSTKGAGRSLLKR